VGAKWLGQKAHPHRRRFTKPNQLGSLRTLTLDALTTVDASPCWTVAPEPWFWFRLPVKAFEPLLTNCRTPVMPVTPVLIAWWLLCADSDHLENAALEHSLAVTCLQTAASSGSSSSMSSSRTLPSCRTDIWDRGLVTTVGVSTNYKLNNEIVGWITQLHSQYFITNFVRMIDNSNKYLLNQIMRASTPKIMKFRICILTRSMYRAWMHSQIVWIHFARVLVETLPSESLV